MAENTDSDKETVKLLKEISSKLSDLNDKNDDRLFQLKMLDLQVRQTNVVFLLTVVVSVGISFVVAYLSVTLSGAIPSSEDNFLANAMEAMYVIFFVAFIMIWYSIHFATVKRINRLREQLKSQQHSDDKA